ncbi:Cystatin-9 [Myotis davidii]|uniref:Cystatin-9 n=1 Tax=Myotis davidii TaxID=225400 RepID=L5M945_MYODS|nr:Cystatin-9 [Myotis davidii]
MEMSSAWAMFLLLAGSQVRVTHSWSFSNEGKGIESYFLATVEYALHIFNVKSKDTNAYRLVSILDSQREKTFICFFTISIDPWRTVFQLLNKTCLEGTY